MRIAWIVASAALAASPSTAGDPDIWLLSVDRWGNAEHSTLRLEQTGGVLTGELNGWPVTGEAVGDRIAFSATDTYGVAYRFQGARAGDMIVGDADYPDTSNTGPRVNHAFKAALLDIPDSGPTRRTYQPKTYSNVFTADLPPALVIQPGDIVATSTIDSGGVDKSGQVVALYGNPQTGPFFVAGAERGDVLAVHIRRLRLNRNYADSLDGVTSRAMSLGLAGRSSGLGARVRWLLDAEAAGPMAGMNIPGMPKLF